jgi:hypothetical protein
MRIKRAIVKNFRSFDHHGVDIEFPDTKVPISIVGQNSAGKSNFLQALLYGLGAKYSNDDTFTLNDFYNRDASTPITIELYVDPPLQSADCFGKVASMPLLRLRAKHEDGCGDVSHLCHDSGGKPVFSPRKIKQAKGKVPTEDEKAAYEELNNTGFQSVRKHRSKIPVHYIDCVNIQNELRANRYTLLGKTLSEIRTEFDDLSSLVEHADGVVPVHVGQPRKHVFERALAYLEKHVLPTPGFRQFVTSVGDVMRKQLEIDPEHLKVDLSQPSADYFFENLEFSITNHEHKPRLPVACMGNGFICLFIIAIIRAAVSETDGGRIFIIEEPETFQHEHFQEYFYKVLCEIAERNQVIYTTHSKKFVNIFEPDSIIHFSNHDCVKTRVHIDRSVKVETPEEVDGFKISNPEHFGSFMRTLEPNIGNIAFASKVIIVEGPHDLLAYRTVLEKDVVLGLKNIAIVCAWGKDPIITLVQLCKKWQTPYFVIHDWDLAGPSVDVSVPSAESADYPHLTPTEKGQYTKNHKILKEAGAGCVHHNKTKLETVLSIAPADKCAASVHERIVDLNIEKAIATFPLFMTQAIAEFALKSVENRGLGPKPF